MILGRAPLHDADQGWKGNEAPFFVLNSCSREMAQKGILPPKLTSCCRKMTGFYSHPLCSRDYRKAFITIVIRATQTRGDFFRERSFSAELVQNEFDKRLPIMMDGYGSGGPKPYWYGRDGPKPDRYGNDYRKRDGYGGDDPKLDGYGGANPKLDEYGINNRKPYGYGADDPKPHVYGSDDYKPHGYGSDDGKPEEYSSDGPKLGSVRKEDEQTYERPTSYTRLKLGMNAPNVHETSQASHKAGLDTTQVDEFERLMDVGAALLKEGEQGLDGRLEVGVAERMLKEAAALFASAIAIDQSSLAAIDALGNTLLVHGKLKLLLSEELRDMLLDARALPPRKRSKVLARVATIERAIPKICEECEELLVEAGRKYHMALSMDKMDDFALYNWGLALFYRAQLIAAEGQEDAAEDADKIYLAAIDKFEATSALKKIYARGALLHRGLALRDRSWLRPMGSNERIRLMEQARRALEDTLQAYPNFVQAKLAVAACIEELEELQSYDKTGGKPQENQNSENWWGWN